MFKSAILWAVGLLPALCSAQVSDTLIRIVEGVGVPGWIELRQERDSIERNWGKSDEYYYTTEKASIKESRKFKQVIKGRVGVQKYRSYYERYALYVKYDHCSNGQCIRQIQFASPRYVTRKGIHVGSTRSEVVAAYGPLDGNVARYPKEGIECVLECDTVTEVDVFVPF